MFCCDGAGRLGPGWLVMMNDVTIPSKEDYQLGTSGTTTFSPESKHNHPNQQDLSLSKSRTIWHPEFSVSESHSRQFGLAHINNVVRVSLVPYMLC